jgi:7-cyano-7-deazaguanine synthase
MNCCPTGGAVVLLSGGLDSAVNLKQAADTEGVAVALTFDYGQRAAKREAAASAAMCHQLGIGHRLIGLPWFPELCQCALVSATSPLPQVTTAQLEEPRVVSGETARAVWIPNRNGVFVNIAAAFAEAMGAKHVIAGFNAEEAATFPDNSADFVVAANSCLRLSAGAEVSLASQTQQLRKQEIVQLGRKIGAPLAFVWSCYDGGREHCGKCESCARLERALRGAGAWEWFQAQRMVP